MKKKYIVKTREEFNCLIKTGICSKNKYFVIYHLPNNKSYDRFGISVGKKIGNAVTRNKYKRKIRSNKIKIFLKYLKQKIKNTKNKQKFFRNNIIYIKNRLYKLPRLYYNTKR